MMPYTQYNSKKPKQHQTLEEEIMAQAKSKATGDLVEHVVVGDLVTLTLVDGTVLKGMYASLGITRGYGIKSTLSSALNPWEFNRSDIKSLIKD
jgi:hypothetical protein